MAVPSPVSVISVPGASEIDGRTPPATGGNTLKILPLGFIKNTYGCRVEIWLGDKAQYRLPMFKYASDEYPLYPEPANVTSSAVNKAIGYFSLSPGAGADTFS